MSRDVLILSPHIRVDAAWRIPADRGVGQAPVMNAQDRPVGLVSLAHLLRLLNEEGGALRDVVARVMSEYHVPALPVVDEQTHALVGIVSRGDVLRCVVTDPPLTLWA